MNKKELLEDIGRGFSKLSDDFEELALLEGNNAPPSDGGGTTPDPDSPPGNPNPDPGDADEEGLIINDCYSKRIPFTGRIDGISLVMDILPGEVRGLHGLLGLSFDKGVWRTWSNYSENGRLFVETAVSSTPKNARPAYKWGGDWVRGRLVIEQGGAVCSINPPGGGGGAVVTHRQTTPFDVENWIDVFFGSSRALEAKEPNHKANIGWRINNGKLLVRSGGTSELEFNLF